MAFDIEMIKAVYEKMPARIAAARALTGKPLTLTEKFFIAIYGKVRLLRHSRAEIPM